MIVPVKHSMWQVLRTVLRAEAAGGPPIGRDLRLNMSRYSQDGTFLDDLVELGLLVRAGKPVVPTPVAAHKDAAVEPEPFRTRYKLTAQGKHAAEYGEYDMPLPGSAPVVPPPVVPTPPAEPPRAKGKRK